MRVRLDYTTTAVEHALLSALDAAPTAVLCETVPEVLPQTVQVVERALERLLASGDCELFYRRYRVTTQGQRRIQRR